jgi:plastocyanin
LIKKIFVLGIIGIVIIASIAVSFSTTVESDLESTTVESDLESTTVESDVIMPSKVSRPGCEEDDRCYIPSKISIEKGKQVTWVNEDSAFHSVTSGSYDYPTTLFDSGHLDPFESYSITFDESGIFDYFCTLHPWMMGQVVVE